MTGWTCRRILLLLMVLSLGACSGPKPILYPNDHFKKAGKEAAEADIAACQEMAEEAGAAPGRSRGGEVAGSTAAGGGIGAAGGAVGGAVAGSPGTGAAVGAAAGATGGLLRGLFRHKKPSDAHVNFVNRCLKEKGYEPVGWK